MTRPGISPWHPARLITSWFGAGYLPFAPGTWGSLAALPFAWLIAYNFGPLGLLIASVVAVGVGIWATQIVLRGTGSKDPGHVVIDEVAGQWLALLPAAPGEPWPWIAAFFAFRLFDILKPWPASHFDRNVSGAAGVVMDDVFAGLYAAILVYAAVYFIPGFGVFPYEQ
jgi:phosphatidylglycerophosphatase A